MHWGDVRWVYVELQQLRETYSVKAETFANVTVRLHPLVMIIHSHKKHISLQILHWTRNDVVVQCSFTRVCLGVPNKMLGASYTNRDVSSFQTRDLYCNGRNMYVQLSHLLFVLEMFRWYVVLDKFVSYSRRQWTSFFHNFKLELYSFCEPCPYSLNNRILRGFHSLVKTKYKFPD